ncbi:MAG: glycosyltransferase family 39 protein [Lachnospiraceae bacterium]|nr:glycosyltransferase family 39 protein [Lachnospiraceae bacterium]
MRKKHRKFKLDENKAYTVLFVLIIFAIFQYAIERIYVFFLYPDEFGYWSSAATILGWDWKEVASLGSYYSFGYSIWLLPILKFITGAPGTYRGAILVNLLLMYLSFFLVTKIAERIIPKAEKKTHILLSELIILFPSWIFHLQFTATECVLFFLFVAITYLMILFLEKPKLQWGVLLALVSGYGFMVHMRFVGVVVAFAATIVLWGVLQSKNRKKLIVLGLALMAVCVLAFFLKNIITNVVYGAAGKEMLNWNDFGGQLGKFAFILTPKGFLALCVNFSGKLLYMGASSMGAFYYWLLWCFHEVIKIFRSLKQEQEIKAESFLAVFLFLAVFAEIGIASIYSVKNAELDWNVYGRYSEFVLPVVMIFGMGWLYKQKDKFSKAVFALCCHTIVSMVCLISFLDTSLQEVRGYMSVGLSLLLRQDEVIPPFYLLGAWCLGAVLIYLWAICLNMLEKNKGRSWVIALLIAGEIFLGLQASHKYIYPVNEYMGEELALGEFLLEEMPEAEILYLREDRVQWIDMIQMQLRERSIDVVELEELPKKAVEGTVLIVHRDGKLRDEAAKWYSKFNEYNIFCLYYN